MYLQCKNQLNIFIIVSKYIYLNTILDNSEWRGVLKIKISLGDQRRERRKLIINIVTKQPHSPRVRSLLHLAHTDAPGTLVNGHSYLTSSAERVEESVFVKISPRHKRKV